MTTHQALMYRTEGSFASGLLQFVLEGVEAGEAVQVAGAPENLDSLRSSIGDASNEVLFVDVRDWYVKPARTLGAYLSLIQKQLEEGRPAVRIIGEVVWPERDMDLQREWIRYEAAINTILADLPVRLMCTYNSERLTPSRIDAARATHPSVIERGVVSASDTYTPPEQMLVELTVRMPLPARHEERRFDTGDAVTAFVFDHARRAGLTEDASSNVAAAASEIVMAAGASASGPALVAVWTDHGDFVCQIEDESSMPLDPLTGYGPPRPEISAGWGWWLARQLSDLLEVGIGSHGSAVRLKMRGPNEIPAGNVPT
jgi:DcmR-like sensory protein/histidine kinase-like protein